MSGAEQVVDILALHGRTRSLYSSTVYLWGLLGEFNDGCEQYDARLRGVDARVLTTDPPRHHTKTQSGAEGLCQSISAVQGRWRPQLDQAVCHVLV